MGGMILMLKYLAVAAVVVPLFGMTDPGAANSTAKTGLLAGIGSGPTSTKQATSKINMKVSFSGTMKIKGGVTYVYTIALKNTGKVTVTKPQIHTPSEITKVLVKSGIPYKTISTGRATYLEWNFKAMKPGVTKQFRLWLKFPKAPKGWGYQLEFDAKTSQTTQQWKIYPKMIYQ